MKARAFTLIELLVTIAIIGILASMMFPRLAASRESGRRTVCANQLRQIQLGLLVYSSDHDGAIPSRFPNTAWPAQLKSYDGFASLACPSEPRRSVTNALPGEIGPRTYIMNGFDDVYRDALSDADWKRFPKVNFNVREAMFPYPAATITLSEKSADSLAQYVELLLAPDDYFRDLNEMRHSGSAGSRGRSNYSFIDGSVQTIPFGKATCPVNQWAASDRWRTEKTLCRPR